MSHLFAYCSSNMSFAFLALRVLFHQFGMCFSPHVFLSPTQANFFGLFRRALSPWNSLWHLTALLICHTALYYCSFSLLIYKHATFLHKI